MAERPTPFSIQLNRERRSILAFINKKLIILSIISFLLGRAGILQGLTPFGIGFFAALNYKDRKYAIIGVPTFLGILSTQGIFSSIPYGITIGIIYLLFYYAMDL